MKDFQNIIWEGRWALDSEKARTCAPAANFSFSFEGNSLDLEMEGEARFKVEIDGNEFPELLTRERKTYRVAEGLSLGVHTARIWKKTESEFGSIALYSTNPQPIASPSKSTFAHTSSGISQIEFIGDSYTVGFGNAARDPITGTPFTTTDASKNYGVLTAQKLGASFAINAYSGRGLVQNYMRIAPNWTIPKLYEYTLCGEAPLGNSPLWDFKRFDPQVVCLFIGINDWQGEGPHPEAKAFDSAYAEFLDKLRERYTQPQFVLISTEVYPVNYLPERVESVLAQELSRGNRDVSHLFLETPHNAGLDFHPNLQRHQQMANSLYLKIKDISIQKKSI
ncbi:MAG: hypothetical protein K6A31_04360 [Fibrobacter sp.]|jgi:hypothetical protein|nr:hypothetical protein [Fibrobacter sp.]